MPSVSLTATLVATLAGVALGALWYGPLFGRAWMKATGTTPDDIRRDFKPVRVYGTTFVLGLIASYVFGLYLGPDPGRAFAVALGAAAGLEDERLDGVRHRDHELPVDAVSVGTVPTSALGLPLLHFRKALLDPVADDPALKLQLVHGLPL